MFKKWFQDRVKDILAEADPAIQKDIEKAAQVMLPLGQALVDYLMLQLDGISLNTQPVKRAEAVKELPEGFRG